MAGYSWASVSSAVRAFMCAEIVTDGQGSFNHQTVPPWTSASERRRWNEIDLWRFAIKWATVRKDERMSYSFHRKENIYSIRSDKPLGFLSRMHREILRARQATLQAPETVCTQLFIYTSWHSHERNGIILVNSLHLKKKKKSRSI